MSKAQVDSKFKSEGRCRLCLRSAKVRPLTRHRIVPGAYGGRYVPQNCVPLCRICHDLVDNRDPATKQSTRRMLRAVLWPVEIGYAKQHGTRFSPRVSYSWRFDTLYPRPTRELVIASRARSQLAMQEAASG